MCCDGVSDSLATCRYEFSLSVKNVTMYLNSETESVVPSI